MSRPSAWHLARRFAGSIRPGPPSVIDERWARDLLSGAEREIWEEMSNPDRRHGVAVARAVAARMGSEATPPILAAALLHDSGKVVSGLRTPARVVATIVWMVVDRARTTSWSLSRWSLKRRLAQYRLHPELGADRLAAAGSHSLTVDWTRQHHLDPDQWTVPPAVASVLKSCDDD